jgi:hypothetical protein
MTMGRIDSQVMQIAATSIMTTQNRRHDLAVLKLAHGAHTGVAGLVRNNRRLGVRFVQANAFDSMPQLGNRCVVVS